MIFNTIKLLLNPKFMKPNFAMLFTPVISMCILTIGNSFYMSYTTLQLEKMGISNSIIGIISASFFAGMMLGSYLSQKLIVRIGYIRSYVLFATLMALSSIMQGILCIPMIWALLRFICGYALAGLFIVVESWCLEGAGQGFKGRILSFYLAIYYFAQASGQFLLNIEFNNTLVAFCIISMLASLSVIPVSITRFEMPKQTNVELLSPFILFKRAPLGMWASFTAGTILGSIYSIYPLFLIQVNHSTEAIAYVMFSVIFGGMILQLPIGKISDFQDRRKVLLIVLVISAIISLSMCFIHNYFWQVIILSFLIGGLTFTIYPISISYSSDNLEASHLVGIVGLLALFYGLGSMFGPIFSTVFMSLVGTSGFFVSISFICVLLITYILCRIYANSRNQQAERVQFQSIAPEASVATETLYEQQMIDKKNNN